MCKVPLDTLYIHASLISILLPHRDAMPRFRAIRHRIDTLRRDLREVVRGLMGYHPPPLIERPPGRSYPTPSRGRNSEASARTLIVVDRIDETPDAVSLILADPSGAPIPFVPGQFFTLLTELEGQTLRRAYSASSDFRQPDRLRLTVKRVQGGVVSNAINDSADVGHHLKLLGPSGDFTYTPDAEADAAHLVLIAGGSGITPIMAILLATLEVETQTRVTLLYGNRNPESIIFRSALDALAQSHPERIHLVHVLENAPDDGHDPRGLLNAEMLDDLLPEEPADAYYLCGPEPMMDAARNTLLRRGVAPDAIREERFSSPHLRTDPNALLPSPDPQPLILRGIPGEATVHPGQTLLDAGLEGGMPLPFSCAMGGCGACKVQLVNGDVVLEEPNCLTPSERDAGYILACVARPRTPITLAT